MSNTTPTVTESCHNSIVTITAHPVGLHTGTWEVDTFDQATPNPHQLGTFQLPTTSGSFSGHTGEKLDTYVVHYGEDTNQILVVESHTSFSVTCTVQPPAHHHHHPVVSGWLGALVMLCAIWRKLGW